VSGKSLAEDIRKFGLPSQEVLFVDDMQTALHEVVARFDPNTLVLCLGAGSITRLADQLAEAVPAQGKPVPAPQSASGSSIVTMRAEKK
jgi:UDP-N-acetylmuramate-alanine ligase